MRRYRRPGMTVVLCIVAGVVALNQAAFGAAGPEPNTPKAEIHTPKPPDSPRINGPSVFGVRPGNPLFYRIPATGARSMEFSVASLPAGLQVDAQTGQITGSLKDPGAYLVTLRAKNALGTSEKKFKIVVGETIALTPPMGWNSWNAYHATITGENVIRAARAMAASGLIDHGWTYINIDDAWQKARGGSFNGIQPNEKFPDFQKMCDEVHALGLKVGIYSTPWTTSYARYIGGSSDDPNGVWSKGGGRRMGKVSFAEADAQQWAAWGIDYLKYDWNPNQTTPRETPEVFHQNTETMRKALRDCGRDIIFSYSNSMRFDNIADQSKLLNGWRTTGDIGDSWQSMATKAFYVNIPRGQTDPQGPPSDRWAPFAGPGHWNDPDMMILGVVNFGGKQHPTRLTPDEQYLHMTQWCMACSPLLLGCDLDKLDEFTLNLITNDEVLAVSQNTLGRQATLASNKNNVLLVYGKDLEDGSKAVALYNLSKEPATVTARWSDLKLSGKQMVRDLWRQKDLGQFDGQFQVPVAPHGAELVKIQPVAAQKAPSPAPAAPIALPGQGLAQHPFLYSGEWDTRKPMQTMFLIKGGKVVWTYEIPIKDPSGNLSEYSDMHLLSNGDIVFAYKTGWRKINQAKETIYDYQCPKLENGWAECHSAQPIGADKVLFMQNGTPAKLFLYNIKTGKIEMEHVMRTKEPVDQKSVHGQFRNVRMTKAGTYLISHMNLGKVSEYDKDWKEIWSCDAPSVWDAVRLNTGNTLISGNQHAFVREINPKGEIVWEVKNGDLPGIKLNGIHQVTRLANGNTVICNWTTGVKRDDWPTIVQVIEVTPEKKVVWAFREWTDPDLGPASCIQLLDEPGADENGDLQR